MSLNLLHKEIASIVGKGLGVAVSHELLRLRIDRELSQFGVSTLSYPLPLAPLRASVELASQGLRLEVNTGNGAYDVDVTFRLVFHLPSGPADFLGAHTLKFVGGSAVLGHDPAQDRMRLFAQQTGSYSFSSENRPQEFAKRLEAANITEQTYDRFEAAALIFSPQEYFLGIIKALPFVPVTESLRRFKLAEPILIDYLATHVVIHSLTAISELPSCIDRAIDPFQFDSVKGDATRSTSVFTASERAVPPAPGIGPIEHGLVYFYSKTILADHTFQIAKPSVTASDRDTELGIFWYYAATAALQSFSLTIAQAGSEARLGVSLPLELVFVAGAGIEIACVKHEVVGAKAIGEIAPLTGVLVAGLEPRGSEIFLEASVTEANVQLAWSSSLGFPLDQIASYLLVNEMNQTGRKIANQKFRFFSMTLADIADIRRFDAGQPVLSSDGLPESACYSVSFD